MITLSFKNAVLMQNVVRQAKTGNRDFRILKVCAEREPGVTDELTMFAPVEDKKIDALPVLKEIPMLTLEVTTSYKDGKLSLNVVKIHQATTA